MGNYEYNNVLKCFVIVDCLFYLHSLFVFFIFFTQRKRRYCIQRLAGYSEPLEIIIRLLNYANKIAGRLGG
jgi:hypothetical protein